VITALDLTVYHAGNAVGRRVYIPSSILRWTTVSKWPSFFFSWRDLAWSLQCDRGI